MSESDRDAAELPARRQVKSRTGRVRKAFAGHSADTGALEQELIDAIEGDVRFDAGSLALYSTDASNYRQVPIGVVVPKTVEDVVRTVEIARRHDVPIMPRGGGTSVAGQTCNTAVVIDFSRYLDRVLEIDPQNRRARVEPGCILDTLRNAAEEHHLTFGPDPATHTHNTLGGMIGNNSGGVHSVMAGLTVDNVETLDVLTYDGTRMTVGQTDDAELKPILAAEDRRADIYRRVLDLRDTHADTLRTGLPKLPRRVSGYANLDWLLPEHGFHLARALVGSEATCVIVLGATLKLVPSPRERVTAVLGFQDIFAAADAVPEVLEHDPLACEGIDDKLIDSIRKSGLHPERAELLPEGKGWLIVEFGGDTTDGAAAQAERLMADFKGCDTRLLRSAGEQKQLTLLRESGLGATASVPDEPDAWEGWEDSAVPRDALGDYLRAFRKLLDKYDYDTVMYGHFGDGLVHNRINFDLRSEEGIAIWRRFMDEAAELVTAFGGSLSGEHGDGQAKARLLDKMYGAELVDVFRSFKEIWDPDHRMNPGKVIDPYPITSNLRFGPDLSLPDIETHFSYPEDKHSFARATFRCVGVGKCRRIDAEGEVMCPSYMATREEKHSTRGRARLLSEMLREGPIKDGWRSDAVEEALDLCFACKGCKSDCPVNVDMATYKAEFRARHYAGRLRPRAAYSMGLIHRWARVAGAVPKLSNAVLEVPGLSAAAKWVGGIAPERALPHFAGESFVNWFRRRDKPAATGRRVLLWPDTFNNYFHPQTAIAATEVLERAGFEVLIPDRPLCCGRALYDWGMLDTAKNLLRQITFELREEIEAGIPLVGLEPACLSAFRDELPRLLPDDPLAQRLSAQSYFFSDFIDANCQRLKFTETGQKALVQFHCHHHAIIGVDAERSLLDRIGTDVIANPTGCCGMAGALGFEAEKQKVSRNAAENMLLPALRAAPPETMILANGFSCREQIRHFENRRAMHVAEAVRNAIR